MFLASDFDIASISALCWNLSPVLTCQRIFPYFSACFFFTFLRVFGHLGRNTNHVTAKPRSRVS